MSSMMAVQNTMMIFDITLDDGWGRPLLLLVVVDERKHAVVGIIAMEQLSALPKMTFGGKYW